jgi:hypothetical protein
MHSDLLVRPVEHRAEGDHEPVFHLTEVGFYFGLGAVSGDNVGDAPPVTIGEQDPLAEQPCRQCSLCRRAGPPGELQLGRLCPGQGRRVDTIQPSGFQDLGDLGLDGSMGLTDVSPGQSGGEL